MATALCAQVCGSKRSYFFDDDNDDDMSFSPVQKRFRCGSPAQISPPRSVENPVPNQTDSESRRDTTAAAEPVDSLVNEMASATSVDDAKARASRFVEVLESSAAERAREEAAQLFGKENAALKEGMETLIKENGILKRAVAILHERQREMEEKERELKSLQLLASQYQEKLRAAEVNNYALSMHLNQALRSSSNPGSCPPGVF